MYPGAAGAGGAVGYVKCVWSATSAPTIEYLLLLKLTKIFLYVKFLCYDVKRPKYPPS